MKVSNVTKVLDDNCIYSQTFDAHVRHVRAFLQRCREKGIHLSEEKSVFAQPEVEFVGAVLSKKGYKMKPKVYEAIEKFPFPTNLTEMRTCYGMANQLAPFNKHLSKALSPLRSLMKKDAVFFLDDERRKAFENAKEIMSSDKTLAFYCQGRPLRLFTDASNVHGLGCVLQQMLSNGTRRPIQVASRSLLDAETRYYPIELELQCVAWATRKCSTFLLGNRFVCYTDHQPLINI